MNKNIGNKDKAVRVILGIVLIVLGVIPWGAWVALAVIGATLLVSAVTGYSGLYSLFGINTNKSGKSSE
ncbi:MAG: YgaP family membrane protein [Spirochaeta sp.]